MTNLVNDFTVCVLLYGDFPQLAQRCLTSLFQHYPPGGHLLLGMNECSPRTLETVNRLMASGSPFATVQAHVSPENIHKYPMMRRMFFHPQHPITTRYIMWFDDDSYLLPPAGMPWLSALHAKMQHAHMLGGIYSKLQEGNQHEWVRHQPWYRGLPVDEQHRFVFATGGWWTIRTEVVQQFNWPLPNIDHCGGDVMLGELCRQNGLLLGRFNEGVAINADVDHLDQSAPRRGFSQPSIGIDFVPLPEDGVRDIR